MKHRLTRRRLLQTSLATGAIAGLGRVVRADVIRADMVRAAESTVHDGFPSQDREKVYQTVLWAHSDIDKVRTLVEGSSALANSAIDWAFGDWETALGAASHMGLRDMAELLLTHGARPDIFTHAMLGHLATVKAIVEAMPGVQRTYGPHGITLLSHAKAGKEPAAAVVEYLEGLGDADPKQVSKPFEIPAEGYLGTYAWGPGADANVVISERKGIVALAYGEGFPRRMFHLGGHQFSPFGTPTLRLRFEVEGDRAIALSIWDPERFLTARLIGSGS